MAYISAADLKTHLKISGTGDDTLLGLLATRTQAIIDRYTGRTFEASSNTIKYFDAEKDIKGRTLYLGDNDLVSINSVTNGDSTVIPSTEYVTEPRNAAPYFAITITAASVYYWTYLDTPENAIAISGKWAYSTSAPSDVIEAALVLAGYLYNQRAFGVLDIPGTPGPDMVPMEARIPWLARDLLAPYRRRI